MRKSVKLLLIIALAVMLAGILAACSGSTGLQYKPPGVIDGKGEVETTEPVGEAAYLSFSYLTQSPSVFKSIYVDEFNLSNIEYHIVYRITNIDENGRKTYTYSAGGGNALTENIVTNPDVLTRAGHDMVFVRINNPQYNAEAESGSLMRKKYVEGSFAIHLKERTAAEWITLSFDLNGGTAHFGSTTDGVANIKIAKGSTYSWSQLVSDFPMTLSGKALSSLGSYNSSSSSIVFNGDTTLAANWTENITKVYFDLNLPADIENSWTPAEGATVTSKTWDIDVASFTGVAARPAVSDFATFQGYTFAGWFTDRIAGDIWNFNTKIGDQTVRLYGRWTVRTYSVTYVLMGGLIDSNAVGAGLDGKTQTQIVPSYYKGYLPGEEGYDENFSANLHTNEPFKITFTGISHGKNLSDYVAAMKPLANSETAINLNAADLFSVLSKGGYYDLTGWYSSSTYESAAVITSDNHSTFTVNDDVILYAKWDLKQNLTSTQRDAYFSYLYDFSKKADGTLRIDKVKDTSVSTLVVPANARYQNANVAISEFGKEAGMNLKTLFKIDASGATNMRTIGDKAFAYCPALRIVDAPVSGEITYVGEDTFVSTAWLNDHSDDFVVIGRVLVKYNSAVGEDGVVNIDTDSTLLGNVKSIAPAAFKGITALRSVVLGAGIERVEDYAFYNCLNLESVTVAEDSALNYVGSAAFNNTEYISTAPADNASTTIDESKFLQLGSIYYRFLGAASDTSAAIPGSVTIIAPGAFSGAGKVVTINFENAEAITKVGTKAFSDTLWVRSDFSSEHVYISDGFVVINKILAAYTGKNTVVTLPSDVEVIASRAFSGVNCDKITNIVIPVGNLRTIETEAFYGSSILNGITFTDATEDVLDINFENNALTGPTGGLVGNATIYLYTDPYAKATEIVIESDSAALKSWKSLKSTYPNIFQTVYTVKAALTSVIPTKYLNSGTNLVFTSGSESNYWASIPASDGTYNSILNESKTAIINGVSVTRSDGITLIEDMPISNFTLTASSGTVGENKAFAFSRSDGIGGATVNGEAYPYSVYSAITNIWISDEENGEEAPLPTFYTSQTKMPTDGIYLVCSLADGQKISYTPDSRNVTYSGYSSSASSGVITFNVDYFGLDTKTVAAAYAVERPANKSLEQQTSFTLPLNANASDYFINIRLLVTKEDGSINSIALNSAEIIDVEDIGSATAPKITMPTDILGCRYVGVRLKSTDNVIFCKLLYSVILTSNASIFSYSILDEELKTAAVTGISNSYKSTIVIPDKVSLSLTGEVSSEGTEYTVVSIANAAFKDRVNLEYVYIPISVTTIGESAFEGCTALKQVRSFVVQSSETAPAVEFSTGLDRQYVVLSENSVFSGNVTITGLAANAPNEVVVPATLQYSITLPGTDTCENDADFTCSVDYASTAFAGFSGTLWLPDTALNREFGATLTDCTVSYYGASSGKTPSAANVFIIPKYETPDNLSGVTNGTVAIISNASLNVTDGVIIIPGSLSGNADNIDYDYAVTALNEAAFAGVFDNGCRTVFLPNTLMKFDGTVSDMYAGHDVIAEGQTEYVAHHVYDVNNDVIMAPSDKFSAYVDTIGRKAFYGCTSLQSLDFNTDGSNALLSVIGDSAFANCISMVELDLSGTLVYEIENDTFNGCTGLTSVTLSDVATVIGNLAFCGCTSLDTFDGMYGVEIIGNFAFYGCSSLESIVIRDYSLTTTGSDAFANSRAQTVLWLMNLEIARTITTDNYGGLLNAAQYVFIPTTSDAPTASFSANFELLTGAQGTFVPRLNPLGNIIYNEESIAETLSFYDQILTFGAANVITVTDPYSGETLSVYVYKAKA